MLTWCPECAMRGRYTIIHSLSILCLLVLLVLTALTAQFGGSQIGDFPCILVYLLIISTNPPTVFLSMQRAEN